jgi:hypothetical protein
LFSGNGTTDVSNGKTMQSKDDISSGEDEKPAPSPPAAPKVGLFQLFKFAAPLDVFLIVLGLFLGKCRLCKFTAFIDDRWYSQSTI